MCCSWSAGWSVSCGTVRGLVGRLAAVLPALLVVSCSPLPFPCGSLLSAVCCCCFEEHATRQERPRLPELGEEPAEGEGEPSTIEKPRMRARLADQGEPARPPWEGWRHDPMPPSSPGETPAGPSTLSEAAVPVEGEAESRPQPRKRHQKRLQRQSGNARKASKGPGRAEGSPRQAKEGTLGPESGGRT